MSWSPFAHTRLLTTRLERAQAELEEDPRLVSAASGIMQVSPPFLVELIEKKFIAAWHSGIEALEASLRLQATNDLLEAGCSVDSVRNALDEAGRGLMAAPGLGRRPTADWAIPPLAAAAMVFGATTLCLLGFWAAYGFHPLFLILGIGAGALPAWATHVLSTRHMAARGRRIVNEYPEWIVRQFTVACEERVAAYTHLVDRLLPAEPVLALPFEENASESEAC